VLDPYRIEARHAELAAPLLWFDAPTVLLSHERQPVRAVGEDMRGGD